MKIIYKTEESYISNERFTNEYLGIINKHFFNIQINIEKIIQNKEIILENTEFSLDFIYLNISNINDIYKSWYFSSNHVDDFVDSSVYDGYEHIRIDVSRIIFKKIDDKKIEIFLEAKILFSERGDRDLKFEKSFIVNNNINLDII